MQRRHFLRNSSLALAAAPFTSLFSRDFSPTGAVGRLKMIRGDVGYYVNRGGTVGLYLPGGAPEGGVIVDTQFPDAAAELLTLLREKGQLAQLDALVNTHHHGDHTGGNAVFAGLATTHLSHARAKQNLADTLAKNDKAGTVPLPSTTFTDDFSQSLDGGKETMTLRHFGPAHTGGDAVIHFENANVVHVGDLIFNRRFPYIDPASGGDILNWAGVMKKIRKHYDKDTTYIFGHAADGYPVTGSAADIKSFENYLKSLKKYVQREKKRGTTLEALKAKTTTVPGAPAFNFGARLRDINLEVMYGVV